MADRIFPNNTNVDMGSKIQFSGIDWSNVEDNIKKQHYSQDNSELLSLLKLAETMMESDNDNDSEDAENDNKYDGKDDLPDFIKEKMKDNEDEDKDEDENEDEDEDKDEDKDEDEDGKRESSNHKMNKIIFTHPSQINAEAIEAAIAKGDKKLVNTILAARKENRLRIANVLKKESEILQRHAERQSLIKQSQDLSLPQVNTNMSTPMNDNTTPQNSDMSNNPFYQVDLNQLLNMAKSFDANYDPSTPSTTVPSELDQAIKAKTQSNNNITASSKNLKFISPSNFTKSQRNAFNRAAISLGMPQEYIQAMAPTNTSLAVASLGNKVKEIIASNMSKETKSVVINGLIKEAKLSPESKSEFINYWNNVLGYQDKDFYPLVAADYDTSGNKI